MEEQEAIVRLKEGDPAGLEYLVNMYYFQAVHTAYLVVRDTSQAEDVVQTAFLNLPKNIERFDEQLPFRPWFLKSILNASINTLEGSSRFVSLKEEPIDEETSFAGFSDPQPSPEEQVITSEMRQTVWDSLGRLTPQQRAVIVMRYFLQFDESEMAQKLDKPKSSIKWWLYSAKKRLRMLLHPLGRT